MNDDFIARKERWARKMAGLEKFIPPSENRLPPGQHLVTNFPVLDIGVKPELTTSDWQLELTGEVEQPKCFDWEAFSGLPQFTDVSDFHCVTTWSQFDMKFAGVAFFTLAEIVKPKTSAKFVLMRSYDDYTTSLTLDAMMDHDVMVATHWNDKPLTPEHGGPARVLVPKLYAWKSAKWIRELRFSETDEPGFWEQRGYSNTADPHTDDRFAR